MSSESLQCTNCMQEYNLSDNLPRILPRFGHTICTSCLTEILKESEPKCPLDKRNFALDQPSLDNFPINIALKKVIMESQEWEVCPIHQEKIKLVCITDRIKLCAYCALFKGHRDHEIKTLAELQPQLIENLQKLQDILKNLNKHYREIQDQTETTRQSFHGIIENRFAELIETITRRKTKLATEIDKYFNRQKKILENSFGENSWLTSNVVEKVIDYENKLRARDIFNLLEDDISDFLVRFDKNIMLNNIENLNLDLSETTKTFEDSLVAQINFLKGLKVPVLSLTGNYSKLYSEFSLEELSFHSQTSTDSEQAVKTENVLENSFRSDNSELIKSTIPPLKSQISSYNSLNSSPLVEIKSRIKFKAVGDSLEIIISNRTSKPISLRSDQWNKIKSTHVTLDRFDFNQEDIDSFKYYWKTLKSISKIHFDCTYQENLQDNHLTELLSTIFEQPENLSQIQINFENTILGDQSLNFIFDDLLPKTSSSLTTLNLNFENTNISDNKISSFAQSSFKKLTKLENFTMNLKKTNLTEHAISELFIRKPSIKKIDLTLDYTSLTDWGLERFVNSMLLHMGQLEKLELWLANTKITDKGASKLFENLPDLQKFRLSFQSTQISDQSIEILAQNKLYNMKPLEDFGLYLEDTKVSEQMKSRIHDIRNELCDSMTIIN